MRRLLNWFERKKHTNEQGDVELPTLLQSRFDPQNRLETLLIDAGYDPTVRSDFEKCFLDHDVFIAIRDDGQVAGLHDDIGELGIYELMAEDGQSYPAGFTCQDRGYECFGPETVMAKMSGRQLLEMIAEAGVWINPSSAFGVLWKSEDLKRITCLR